MFHGPPSFDWASAQRARATTETARVKGGPPLDHGDNVEANHAKKAAVARRSLAHNLRATISEPRNRNRCFLQVPEGDTAFRPSCTVASSAAASASCTRLPTVSQS
jgi:hypothetical protein